MPENFGNEALFYRIKTTSPRNLESLEINFLDPTIILSSNKNGYFKVNKDPTILMLRQQIDNAVGDLAWYEFLKNNLYIKEMSHIKCSLGQLCYDFALGRIFKTYKLPSMFGLKPRAFA